VSGTAGGGGARFFLALMGLSSQRIGEDLPARRRLLTTVELSTSMVGSLQASVRLGWKVCEVLGTVTIEIDEEALQALDRLSRRTKRSRSELLGQAVLDYIELQTWQLAKIETGIEAADQGDFATEQELERIVRKYTDSG
jgi:predicted transcriptional regulator